MSNTTTSAHNSSRTGKPFNPGRRHRADFARQAVFAEFRSRDAKSILDVDFIDRAPRAAPRLSPEARPR